VATVSKKLSMHGSKQGGGCISWPRNFMSFLLIVVIMIFSATTAAKQSYDLRFESATVLVCACIVHTWPERPKGTTSRQETREPCTIEATVRTCLEIAWVSVPAGLHSCRRPAWVLSRFCAWNN